MSQDSLQHHQMPDSMLSAYLKANTLIPQCNEALRIIAGSQAIKLINSGDITWEELPTLRVGEAQLQKAQTAAAALHNKYKIPCTLSTEFNRYEKLYTTERLANLATGWITGVRDISTQHAMVRGLIPWSSIQMGYPETGNTLFARSAKDQPSEEAVALEALWRGAKALLCETDAGKALIKNYFDVIKKGEANFESYHGFANGVSGLLDSELTDSMREECAKSGVPPLPRDAVNFFIRKIKDIK